MNDNSSSPITRQDLKVYLKKRLSISLRTASIIVDSLFDTIGEALSNKHNVSLMGIGRFTVKYTKPRPGRNPKTGAYVEVPSSYKATFAMSRSLRQRFMNFVEETQEFSYEIKPNAVFGNKDKKRNHGSGGKGGENKSKT
jgi:nucleoid DNA-binding protein